MYCFQSVLLINKEYSNVKMLYNTILIIEYNNILFVLNYK